jgi:hypothetical protein
MRTIASAHWFQSARGIVRARNDDRRREVGSSGAGSVHVGSTASRGNLMSLIRVVSTHGSRRV